METMWRHVSTDRAVAIMQANPTRHTTSIQHDWIRGEMLTDGRPVLYRINQGDRDQYFEPVAR